MVSIKKQISWAIFSLMICSISVNCQNTGSTTNTTPTNVVGVPASDVGVAASDVGVPASDVGVPASDVGTPVMTAVPPAYTDQEMTFHVAGNTSDVNGSNVHITSPTGATTWIANQTNTVTWTGSTPERLSIQLINDDTSILASGMSLRASVETSDGSATCDVPNVKESDGYYIRFYDQLDISKTLATSDKFKIIKQTSAPLQPSSGVDVSPLVNGPGYNGSTATSTGQTTPTTSGNAVNSTTTGALPGTNGSSSKFGFQLSLAYAALIVAVACIWM